MKANEAKVLEGLRKSTLAYLSEKEYAEIVDAVEKHGLLSLTGAASRIVKGAVVKHGSHDQKTHGRGGKGGGGSGGSPSSTSPQADKDRSDASKNLYENMVEAEKEIEDLEMGLETNPEFDAAQAARQKIEGAIPDFFEARKLTGKAQTKKLQSGVDKIVAAQNALVKIDTKSADDFLSRFTVAVQGSLGESSQSVFDKLGVDADAIFLD